MSREDLEAEYKEIEELWYSLEADKGLYWEAYEDDPIWNITERDTKEFVDRLGKIQWLTIYRYMLYYKYNNKQDPQKGS